MSKHIKAAMPNQSNTWERVSKKYQKEAFLFFLASTILIVLAFFIGTAYADPPKPAIRKFRTTEIYGPPAPQLSIYQEKEIRRFYSTSTTTTTTTVPAPSTALALRGQKVQEVVETPSVPPIDYNAIPPYPGSPQDWMREAGIPESDWPQAELLVSREGGWRPCVANGGKIDCNYVGSKAYGIPQAIGGGTKMASEGDDWRTNPVTQLRWMRKYVERSYGTWSNANAKWESRSPHWY